LKITGIAKSLIFLEKNDGFENVEIKRGTLIPRKITYNDRNIFSAVMPSTRKRKG
jgi:hypothetical protein